MASTIQTIRAIYRMAEYLQVSIRILDTHDNTTGMPLVQADASDGEQIVTCGSLKGYWHWLSEVSRDK